MEEPVPVKSWLYIQTDCLYLEQRLLQNLSIIRSIALKFMELISSQIRVSLYQQLLISASGTNGKLKSEMENLPSQTVIMWNGPVQKLLPSSKVCVPHIFILTTYIKLKVVA